MNFKKYINENQLFTPQDRLLIAVSGGVDSVVLLDMLSGYFAQFSAIEIGNSLAIAHCNFGLRGQESEDDEAFVFALSQQYQCPFFVKKFDTLAFAEQHSLSIQVAARELRYTWFYELLELQHFQYLATAHHANDSIETLLYNLTKGTGIAGLHGILPRQGQIIRPLLHFSKEEIEQYALRQQLAWREDSSNATDKYSRNLIRHSVIPILKQINPNLEGTFQDTMLRIRAVERIFQNAVQKFREKLSIVSSPIDKFATYYLDIELIKSESENLIKMYEILKEFGFNFIQIQMIINSLNQEAGKLFASHSHTLVRDRTCLVLTPLMISPVPQLMRRVFLKTTDFQYSTDTNCVHLDYVKIGETFDIRLWKEGDKFSPLGMKGKVKNVSDFLNDLKLPLNLKKQVYVLVCQGQIAWVIGYRISELFKVTEITNTILELSIASDKKI